MFGPSCNQSGVTLNVPLMPASTLVEMQSLVGLSFASTHRTFGLPNPPVSSRPSTDGTQPPVNPYVPLAIVTDNVIEPSIDPPITTYSPTTFGMLSGAGNGISTHPCTFAVSVTENTIGSLTVNVASPMTASGIFALEYDRFTSASSLAFPVSPALTPTDAPTPLVMPSARPHAGLAVPPPNSLVFSKLNCDRSCSGIENVERCTYKYSSAHPVMSTLQSWLLRPFAASAENTDTP